MNVSIFGLGYVGAVSLACLARDGHHVIGVDVDPAKLDLIAAGKTPVVEEGMVDLMASVVASGRVTVTADVQNALLGSSVSFVCVGTPSSENGSQDQTALVRLAAEIGKSLRHKRDAHVVVIRSTITPGTVEDILIPILQRESGKAERDGFHVAFQPEFLREGSSIRDYDAPPFTIVGTESDEAAKALDSLFGHLPCKFHRTSIRAAEAVKVVCNNFHALKITFANETARLCGAMGIDPFAVMSLICEDRQLNISPAYLRPGFAFGGSCLPKDLRATLHLAKSRDVDVPLLSSILPSNRAHIELAMAKVRASGARSVGMLGLSFKAGTDDLRESPLVALAEHFIGKGLKLAIYDPDVQLSRLLGANRRFIEQQLPHIGELLRDDIRSVIAASDVLVVAHANALVVDWLVRESRPGQMIVDLVNLDKRGSMRAEVVGLCW